MSIGAVIVIVAVVVIVAVMAFAGAAEFRKRRGVTSSTGWKPRPISAEEREYFRTDWEHVQGSFISDPTVALDSADKLVLDLLQTQSDPERGPEELLDFIAAREGNTIAGYREARDVHRASQEAPGTIHTESLRQAMTNYGAFLRAILDLSGTADPAIGRS